MLDTGIQMNMKARQESLITTFAIEKMEELLFAADGLVTVDSFASSEALVLGRPVMVVNLPSNLGALVERGVAVGVPREDS